MKPHSLTRFLIPLEVVVASASVCMIMLIPVGEAPDEQAHIAYIDHLTRTGSLPETENAWAGVCYEAHQPPLAYGVATLLVRASGFGGLGYEFIRNPDFRFERGGRAFLDPPHTAQMVHDRRAVRAARGVSLVWLAITQAMILMICVRVAKSRTAALAAALPFCLSPQLIFVCSTSNNDAASIAFCSVVIVGLYEVLTNSQIRPWMVIVISVAAGLAFWSKSNAVVVLPGLAIATVVLIRNRSWRIAASLVIPGAIVVGAWCLFSIARTGGVLSLPPDVPGMNPGGFGRLILDPWWVLSAWIGYWAKFGWFNLPLPAPLYLAFLPPTLLAMLGFRDCVANHRLRSASNLVLVVVVVTNLITLVAFMARVDWQPQGRYLLPSIVAAAGLCALGLNRFSDSMAVRFMPKVAAVSATVSCSAIAAALWIVGNTYR